MISHRHRCIFIHIPKCAGTSFEALLGHLDGHTGRSGQDHRSVRMIQQPWLSPRVLTNAENAKDAVRRLRENFRTAANPNNKLMVTREQFADYFKFTVVRNPWQRAWSWYRNAMRDPVQQNNYGIDPTLDFSAFMRRFVGTGFLRPQTYWLRDYDGNIPMDYVARFETLQEDFAVICQRLGLGEATLPHRIEGGNSDPRAHFDRATIELIGDYYREEIELFGYRFE